MSNSSIKLSELNTRIRNATESFFPEAVWITAEILEMQINRSGHCYLELIEKSEAENKIVAKSRATIWAFKFRMLRPYFESVTGTKLQAGIKVLIKAEVSFHEIYGLSLNVTDIDPSYTMGDIALRKREIMMKLEASGLMNMNRELQITEVPQRIAVVSSETAAGFGDFTDSLVNNSYNYYFSITLFPAILQGDGAEDSIIRALEKVYEMEDTFDIVVLIRGGGSQADLDCFNGYNLAMNIAQFPIPVLTGIGHERDETIADIVAHASLKTPTAVAEFLIDKLLDFSSKLNRIRERFEQTARWIVQQQTLILQQKGSDLNYLVQQYLLEEGRNNKDFKSRINQASKNLLSSTEANLKENSRRLKYLWKSISEHNKQDISFLQEKIKRSTRPYLRSKNDSLRNLEKSLELIKPEKVLSRGYSITYSEGKVIKTTESLKKGSKIKTQLYSGTIDSEINNIQKD